MFERYTEKARRCIFWGRYEASQDGSPTIECEHLLLGMLREHHALLGGTLDQVKFSEELRLEMTRGKPHRQPTSTSVDLPLSHEAKRVLAYGAEEAERMKHKHIGSEHLLLGMLREEGSLPTRLLRQHGIELGQTRERIAAILPTQQPSGDSPVDRNALRAMIDALPEPALFHAWNMLMQAWPPRVPPEISELRRQRGQVGSRFELGGIAGSGAKRDGSRSSSHTEDGALIRQTQEVFHGHEIAIKERFKMSDDGKQLKYSQHLRGPNREHQIEIDFDLP